MVTRQGVSIIHEDDLREEQALRVRAVELAVQTFEYSEVGWLIKDAQAILDFLTPDTTSETSTE